MIPLRPLIISALLANLLTLALYCYVTGLPAGSGMDLLYIIIAMPAIWLTTIIVAIIIINAKGKSLFQKPVLGWTILTLPFTTPIPAVALYYLTNPTPETRRDGEMIYTSNGRVYKLETWERTSDHKKFAHKYFVADSAQVALYGDKEYKKDSIWVYFDTNGDTLKLDYYKDNSLIMTKQLKEK